MQLTVMKGLLLVLSIVFLHTNADTVQLLDENLGPVDFQVKIGNLPRKYIPMSFMDIKATKAAVNLTEWLRQYFETGIRPVPPLDPLQLDNLDPLEIESNSLISGVVNLENFYMTGLKAFILDDGEIRLRDHRLDFSVSVPLISAEIDFDAELSFGFLPISFGGHLRVDLQRLDIEGALGAKPTLMNGRNVFQVDSLGIMALARNVQVQVSRLHFSDDDLMDEQLSVATWFEDLKDTIALNAAKTAIKEINKVLLEFPADLTHKYLLGN